jgi:hypothetical protein
MTFRCEVANTLEVGWYWKMELQGILLGVDGHNNSGERFDQACFRSRKWL